MSDAMAGANIRVHVLADHLLRQCSGPRVLLVGAEDPLARALCERPGIEAVPTIAAAGAAEYDTVALLGAPITEPPPVGPPLRTGGRMIFTSPEAACRADLLAALANGLDARIAAVIPFGLLMGRAAPNRWLCGSQAQGITWERVLSHSAREPRFLAFCLFLETMLVAHLPPAATAASLVVLEATRDPAANAAFVVRSAAYAHELASEVSLEAIARFAAFEVAAWRAAFASHLRFAPNRIVLSRLLSATLNWPVRIDLDSFMDRALADEQRRYNRAQRLDRDVSRFVLSWFEQPETPAPLTYQGLHIAPELKYQLMQDLLREGFGAFAGTAPQFSGDEPLARREGTTR